MWKVLFTAEAERDIKDLLKTGEMKNADREVIATWIRQVQEWGPDSLRSGSNFWYDHDLFDEWKGHRASAYSFKGRIIYKVQDKRIIVLVIRITASHDYSKE
jgi:mRNA-degrading endonuclease YafQ of YafQ-DinJ toxin-antitoxin module